MCQRFTFLLCLYCSWLLVPSCFCANMCPCMCLVITQDIAICLCLWWVIVSVSLSPSPMFCNHVTPLKYLHFPQCFVRERQKNLGMTGAFFVYANVYACYSCFHLPLCFRFTGVCSGHTDVWHMLTFSDCWPVLLFLVPLLSFLASWPAMHSLRQEITSFSAESRALACSTSSRYVLPHTLTLPCSLTPFYTGCSGSKCAVTNTSI